MVRAPTHRLLWLGAARLRGEGWPAALFQAAVVALIGKLLIAFKALVH
jgi:hypothetical protein